MKVFIKTPLATVYIFYTLSGCIKYGALVSISLGVEQVHFIPHVYVQNSRKAPRRILYA